jgi:hypothetical protein
VNEKIVYESYGPKKLVSQVEKSYSGGKGWSGTSFEVFLSNTLWWRKVASAR